MKIRKLTAEKHVNVLALLRQTFSGSRYEVNLFNNLHKNDRTMHEWVCIQRGKVVAYIAFTNAFAGDEVCGLHLAPIAVQSKLQNQGIGSELIRFSLRQDIIRERTIFVLGDQVFYQKFGFEPCATPICPFTKNNRNFSSLGNTVQHQYTVGYETEFNRA